LRVLPSSKPGAIQYGQQRREVDMANLVYAGTIDERVYQRLSERMQDRYDILGSRPGVTRAFSFSRGRCSGLS
jgi:hypothetical protein